jgi:hypothetical protein
LPFTDAGWLTVEEHFASEERRGGRGCVLIEPAAADDALNKFRWIGRELGEVSIFDKRGFEDGLTTTNAGVVSEFFVQVRNPSGAAQ